jgi:N-dimethylarginine dimethylaminohydrolase
MRPVVHLPHGLTNKVTAEADAPSSGYLVGKLMSKFGAQNMAGPLRRVLMKRPGPAMANADPEQWHFAGPLALAQLRANHDHLVDAIRAAGAEVLFLEEDSPDLADAVFTHDPSLVTSGGAVILRMGKRLRDREPELHREFYLRQGIPILGVIQEPGTVEAGDCLWLDENTLAVGLGFRTNEAGLSQLQSILSPLGVSVLRFDLPVAGGPGACLHLMSLISLLDSNLALAHVPQLPVRLYQLLNERQIECLSAPVDEYAASGTISVNVLAVGPRQCVMVAGFPQSAELLRRTGCTVTTFPGDELCLKAEGGPTCLTRPILREYG